jgi:indoleamine 2,3-dioxygenase
LGILEEIYFFRNGHWQFVQKYIMANTPYAKATGGTPITSWLPNQIKSVLNQIQDVINAMSSIDNNGDETANEIFNRLQQTIAQKKQLLADQLAMVEEAHFSPDKVFSLNEKYDLKDEKH